MITIPDYDIQSKIFESDRFEVFRGKKLKNNDSVILKILKNENSHHIAELNHEFKMLSILSEITGISKVYQSSKFQNRYYLVTEDISGESLKNMIHSQQPELAEILSIAIDIITIIGNIHGENVIHKDINPSNIVINANTGQIQIIDFGISTQLSIETPNIKTFNTLEGTLEYLSPEQTGRINRFLDYRTDYYSFGVCLFEMLTRQLPFILSDPMEMVHCHIAKTPPLPHELNTDIPVALSEIVMKLMAKNAEDRYQSSSGIISDLNRCLNEYQSSGNINAFRLAQRDIPEKFKIPQKLYGRDKEIDRLLKSFKHASQKNAELLMVSGYSGIGKTVLVKEIYKSIQELKGYFISGKFDQFQRNMPYKAIVEAFKELIKQLLIESDEKLVQWKSKILDALGPNAQVIIEVIPDLSLIIGDQPKVAVLPPDESKNRFNYIFQNFIHVFAQPAHPLVLFLDDLQWADDPSLNLFQMILKDKDHSLLLIGSYRNNEVDSTHSLIKTIASIKAEGAVAVNELFLEPLKIQDIQHLITETLFCENYQQSKSLAELIGAKTGGNPFFINEFLKALYSKELIFFNKDESKDQGLGWQWDLTKIKNEGMTENVVELMTQKIRAFDTQIQNTLSLAACIGNTFDLKTLSIVSEQPVITTAKQLLDSISSELLICLGDVNKINKVTDKTSDAIVDMMFKFSHDRIQQAAYSLIDQSHIASLHYKIGELLLNNTPEDTRGEKLFDIVDHLNYGANLIDNADKKIEMAGLNLQAGRKARESAAYKPAFEYFLIGLKYLHKDSWEIQYELALSLHVDCCESAYLTGDFETMERISTIILDKAKSEVDKTKVYEVKIVAYSAQNRQLDAIQEAFSALERFGIKLPKKPGKFQTLYSLIKTKLCLIGKDIQGLAHNPAMTDPMIISASSILHIAATAAYSVQPELYAVIVLQRVRLSVKYGNSIVSSSGYGAYGIILIGILDEIESGYRFGKLAIQVNESNELRSKAIESRVIFIFNYFLRVWKEHLKNSTEALENGFKVGLENGDLEYAAFCLSMHFTISFVAGINLSDLKKRIFEYTKQMELTNNQLCIYRFYYLRSAILNLTHECENTSVLSDDKYNEYTMILIHKQKNDRASLAGLYCIKMILAVIFQEHEISLENAQSLYQNLDAGRGTFIVVSYFFYNALIKSEFFDKSPQIEKNRILKQISKSQKKLKKWSKFAPMNFLNKYYLVKAQKCKILGQHNKAINYYEKAIHYASESDFHHEEGLAAELCGKFWLDKGNENVASVYIQKSYRAYQNWGAVNKIRHLEKKYPQLLKNNPMNWGNLNHTITQTSQSTQTGQSLLDLNTVFKSSQAISQEIELSNLLKKLMMIAKENAGAETGILILEEHKKFCVVFQSFENSRFSEEIIPIEDFEFIPKTVFQYMARSSEHVVLNNAFKEGMFLQDPYILKNQTKSILCSPIIHQNVLIGAVYLENNQTKSAFTNDRVEMISLLVSQAAISIQNSKFYMEIKTAEEKFRSIFENSMEGIFRSTPDGKFIDANPSMAKILGYQSPAELMESNINIAAQCYASPEDRNTFLNEILTHGKIFKQEGEFKRRDSNLGWGVLSARAIRDKDDNIAFFEGTFNDITDKKEKEVADRKRIILEGINEKIMESIRYAKMIQSSLLPDRRIIDKLIPESFFLYQPKDIVGGDIYFVDEINHGFILAVIDCTGHGVPGAFMTMIACSALKRIIKDERTDDPSMILQKLNIAVKTTLHQDTDHGLSDDGMDIGICVVYPLKSQLIFAGAKLPLFYYFDHQVHPVKPNKQSIGYKKSKHSHIDFKFSNHVIDLQKGMIFYLTTDGFQDQMGGIKEKRFGKTRFINTLKDISQLSLENQKQKLLEIFHEHSGDNDIQDDFTIVGFKV